MEKKLAPAYAPICPPKSTTATRDSQMDKSGSWLDRRTDRPEREFKKMKALVIAAVCFASVQRMDSKIGPKKMPPPIPTIPLNRPKAPPIMEATKIFLD